MENDKIILVLGEEINVELSSNTPDMQKMIDTIVKNREKINLDKIDVQISENSNFDKQGFIEMIENVINAYLEDLKLEEINYTNSLQNV